jgi:hypothetical protein
MPIALRSNQPNHERHQCWKERHGRKNYVERDGKRHSGVVDCSETHLITVAAEIAYFIWASSLGGLFAYRRDGHH